MMVILWLYDWLYDGHMMVILWLYSAYMMGVLWLYYGYIMVT